MIGEILLPNGPASVLLCALAGVGVAAILYLGDRELPAPKRLGLAALRAVAVGLLAFLLAGPLLRSVDTRTQRPVVVVAEDRSSSARAALDGVASELDALAARLAGTYEVERIAVGESVRAAGDTLRDAATDLAAAFEYAADAYPPELLAGVVLATDGIYNQGADPAYAAARVNAPAFAVMLGDTTPTRDVAVRDVLYNRIAYLGDRLEVQVDVQATNLSGGGATVTLVEVGPGGRELGRERVAFSGERDFATVRFEVEPTRAGVQRYRVRASTGAEERNVANNARELYVDVLDARQRVLVLADAPHPDIAAVRQALDGNKNYETGYALARDFAGDLAEVDLLVLHNLPSARRDVAPVLAEAERRGIGLWIISGPVAPTPAFNASQPLLNLTRTGTQANQVTAEVNGNFRLFTVGEDWSQVLRGLPPVTAPFGEYGPLAAGDVLLTQRIGRVSTDYPLLAMGEVQGRKVGVFSGQGLWRWRLAEYQETQDHRVVDELITATVQYLALRADKRPFRVTSAERVYTTSDDIRLDGELYNASFQLVNEPDVDVRLVDADGTDYRYLMDKAGAAYRLRAGRLPAGSYTYTATTRYDGQDYSASGGFTVRELQLEAIATTADWDLLRRLAAQQGGVAVTGDGVGAIADALLGGEAGRPILYQSVRTRPLIDWPWLLAIVLALLSVEWFVRRRAGTY